MTLRLTDAAEYNLAEIWASIATRVLQAMRKTLDVLLHSPVIGPKRQQFGSGFCVTFHSPYAVCYLPCELDLITGRVLHGSRDAAAIVEKGGFIP